MQKYLETNENKIHQNYEVQQSSSKREVHSNKGLPEDANKQQNITLQVTRRRKNEVQSQQNEGNNKDQSGNE